MFIVHVENGAQEASNSFMQAMFTINECAMEGIASISCIRKLTWMRNSLQIDRRLVYRIYWYFNTFYEFSMNADHFAGKFSNAWRIYDSVLHKIGLIFSIPSRKFTVASKCIARFFLSFYYFEGMQIKCGSCGDIFFSFSKTISHPKTIVLKCISIMQQNLLQIEQFYGMKME